MTLFYSKCRNAVYDDSNHKISFAVKAGGKVERSVKHVRLLEGSKTLFDSATLGQTLYCCMVDACVAEMLKENLEDITLQGLYRGSEYTLSLKSDFLHYVITLQ
jgi:hypothetical protein